MTDAPQHPTDDSGNLVSAEWLRQHLGDDGIVVVDASIALGGVREDGIPGALRFDIDGAMSRHDVGVHTMLAPDDFERELRALGINDDDRLIAYDASGIFSSARAWWMLRAAGVRAAVLDGGLPAWIEAGGSLAPVQDRTGVVGNVTVRWNPDAFVDAETIAEIVGRAATGSGGADSDGAARACAELNRAEAERAVMASAVVDARSAERFAGSAPEPRAGVRSGHIPGAQSLPFLSLQREGHLVPPDELRARLVEVAGESPVVASCGSGVTASVIALAATLTGREARVYDGSWAEWGAEDSGRPVATGPAPSP